MSDFLFTREQGVLHRLVQPLKDLMPEPEQVVVKAFSGSWGSLATSLGPYNGFAPYEDSDYICVVIGGPVFYWQDNHFLTNPQQPTAATQAILQRWQIGLIDWSEDLSGPFTTLIVNKKSDELFCYTDLMMFVPVFQYATDTELCLGTHIDTVAKIARQQQNIDNVSIADFILTGRVTYPHTVYSNLFQLVPATEHKWTLKRNEYIEQHTPYWQPLELNPYKSIDEAALALRIGLKNYIERITETMTQVGHFISAGEDSRSITGLLPKRLKRHAYIYVDSKNREFKLAKRVADTYGCEFHYIFRDPMHYLNILPDASKLVGAGQQYTHAHTLDLIEKSGADEHDAVFGGFISDTLLKGVWRKRFDITKRLPFLPDFFIQYNDINISDPTSFFTDKTMNEINIRRLAHFKHIKKLRPKSSYEWFFLWPATMQICFPNISVNRRLFPSYEVFTSKDSVKISAAAPIEWKMNRKLFHKAVKPALKASKWIPHSDGRLPYYPWYVNSFLQLPTFAKKRFKMIIKKDTNDGPWNNWGVIINSSEWVNLINSYITNIKKVGLNEDYVSKYRIFVESNLNKDSKVNFLQTLYLVSELDKDM